MWNANERGRTTKRLRRPHLRRGGLDTARNLGDQCARSGEDATAAIYIHHDLRAGYRLQLGGARTLDLFLDMFNLTNRANFANPAVDQRLPATFLRLLDVSDEGPTRTAQLNIRFGF